MTDTTGPRDAVTLDLSGRTALVTGAGSGIGRATTLRWRAPAPTSAGST